MNLKRILNGLILIGVGFIAGALTQAAAEIEQRAEARREYCVPLYDMPGVERIVCDPAG